jgi:molybdopterin-biosynthesis enzyme MoeA-like protein
VYATTPTFAVLALAGVPEEMCALVEAAADVIAARLGVPIFHAERELASACRDESRLTTLAERVMALHPGVHVKSLATAFASGEPLRLVVTATAPTPTAAETRVAAAADALVALLPSQKE